MRRTTVLPGSAASPRRPGRAWAAGVLALAVLAMHALLFERIVQPAAPSTAMPAPAARQPVFLARPHAVAAKAWAERPARRTVVSPEPGPARAGVARKTVEPSNAPSAEIAAAGRPLDMTTTTAQAPATAWRPPPRDDAPMPEDPPPVYATKPPPAARLHYALRRGGASGQAMLVWRPGSEGYRLQLQATLPAGATLDQLSQGGFDDAGLAPLRLADRRRGRAAQAVNFQRSQRRITFSGPSWEYPLVPGVQDRLSWIVQLVAIAAASAPARGDELVLQVVGARGATARWRFRVAGTEHIDVTEGRVDALRLVREPEHLYDLRIELWLDPTRAHWPLRLRQTQVPGGEALDWALVDGPVPPDGT